MLKLIITLMLAISPVFAKNIILKKSNTVVLNQAFDSSSTSKVIKDVLKLSEGIKSGEVLDIYLILDTPGGEIGAGLMMIDTLNSIPGVKVHTITLFAASMGFITAQGLNKRYITNSGTLMSHKARGGFRGEFPGQLDSRYNYYLRRLKRIDNGIVKRTKGIHTLKSYRKLMENEYWCEGEDCLKQGFADEIANVSCGKSLIKDVVETVTLRFFGMTTTLKVKKSLCPLVLGFEPVKAFINGKEYKFNNPMINHQIKKGLNRRFNTRNK